MALPLWLSHVFSLKPSRVSIVAGQNRLTQVLHFVASLIDMQTCFLSSKATRKVSTPTFAAVFCIKARRCSVGPLPAKTGHLYSNLHRLRFMRRSSIGESLRLTPCEDAGAAK